MTYICNCACDRCLAGSCCWAPPPMHNWNPGGTGVSETGGWAAAQRLSEMHTEAEVDAERLAAALRQRLANPTSVPAREVAEEALAAHDRRRNIDPEDEA